MHAIFVPKYKIYYRVSPKEPNVLQWSNKPFGPATQWQTAMRFGKPIRALDTDDKTGQGVVVLNDSSTYVGSGVRVWGRKFYPAGTRIYSLYAIGESKMKHKLKIKIHESKKKGDVDLDAMMGEFKQALGNDFKLKAFSENTKIGQQLVIAVAGVGEFFCLYELVYNGGSFKVRTWDADSTFDMKCDMSIFKKLETIFNKYCA